jgi:prefoldin subunit 5
MSRHVDLDDLTAELELLTAQLKSVAEDINSLTRGGQVLTDAQIERYHAQVAKLETAAELIRPTR